MPGSGSGSGTRWTLPTKHSPGPLESPRRPIRPPRPSQITKRPKTFAQFTLGLVSKQMSTSPTSPHRPGPIWFCSRLPPASGCGSSPSWALGRVPLWLTTSQAKCIRFPIIAINFFKVYKIRNEMAPHSKKELLDAANSYTNILLVRLFTE